MNLKGFKVVSIEVISGLKLVRFDRWGRKVGFVRDRPDTMRATLQSEHTTLTVETADQRLTKQLQTLVERQWKKP